MRFSQKVWQNFVRISQKQEIRDRKSGNEVLFGKVRKIIFFPVKVRIKEYLIKVREK